MSILDFIRPEMGGILVKIIAWLVKITSSVALGVILFTLILKLITLPFDFVSRVSMRKNSVKMEQMRPELEKLQRQYADNKELYNQKMMALYKKNGYSMFGACLPTIITLVIFIVAIQGFTNFSKYQNVKYFYDMSVAYNNTIYTSFDIDENNKYILLKDGEEFTVLDDELYNSDSDITFTNKDGEQINIYIEKTENSLTVSTTNSFVEYKRSFENSDNGKIWGLIEYKVIDEKITNGNLKFNGKTYDEVKQETLQERQNNLNEKQEAYNKALSEYESAKPRRKDLAKQNLNTAEENLKFAQEQNEFAPSYFAKLVASQNAKECFDNNGSKFLWIKNIWVADTTTKHPVQSYNEFNTTISAQGCGACNCSKAEYDIPSKAVYEELTLSLGEEKTKPNGYYVLVALTILTTLLTQIVMSKSQKAQMELQTVDGQGAQQQKMMMWMMPIMMAIFAFSYSAAFSIYIILSSIISLITTLLINLFVDKKMQKEIVSSKKDIVRGRVYVKKEEPKKEQPKKTKVVENDFLSGLADKKKKK